MNMEKTKKCPKCGGEILAIATKCKHCKAWLTEQQTTMDCPKCGEIVSTKEGESKGLPIDCKTIYGVTILYFTIALLLTDWLLECGVNEFQMVVAVLSGFILLPYLCYSVVKTNAKPSSSPSAIGLGCAVAGVLVSFTSDIYINTWAILCFMVAIRLALQEVLTSGKLLPIYSLVIGLSGITVWVVWSAYRLLLFL